MLVVREQILQLKVLPQQSLGDRVVEIDRYWDPL